MASLVLGNNATTLHHWSGIGDGRYTEEELRNLYTSDDRFSDARKRVRDADVLVIDEVGMLSEAVFQKLELVCRLGRENDTYFGGLQVTKTEATCNLDVLLSEISRHIFALFSWTHGLLLS